jgi:hypothetical protein
MTTTTDIGNRALAMLGSRTNMASLAENSNEAVQINLVYSIVTDWAFAATNWNFARKVIALSSTKSVVLPPGTWTSASPQPPWLNEFVLPTDFIRAVYVTNMAAQGTTNYAGEPQRFVLGTDIITAVQQEVLLSNAANAILVYTSRVTDPTLWPAMFERFAVAALANAIVFQLTGDKSLANLMREQMMTFFQIAEQQNVAEELLYTDVTPEWIQAIGIKYPIRRYGPRGPVPEPPRQQNDRQQQR